VCDEAAHPDRRWSRVEQPGRAGLVVREPERRRPERHQQPGTFPRRERLLIGADGVAIDDDTEIRAFREPGGVPIDRRRIVSHRDEGAAHPCGSHTNRRLGLGRDEGGSGEQRTDDGDREAGKHRRPAYRTGMARPARCPSLTLTYR